MQNKIWNDMLVQTGQLLTRKRSEATVRKILIGLFGAAFLLSSFLISEPYLWGSLKYHIGDTANEDIRVLQDIVYELPEKTAGLRKQAYEKERFVFYRDANVLQQITSDVQTEFRMLAHTAKEENPLQSAYKRLPWLKSSSNTFSEKNIRESMSPQNRDQLTDWAVTYARLIFDSYGIIKKDVPFRKDLRKVGAVVMTVNGTDQPELIWEADQILPVGKIFDSYYYTRLNQLGDYAFQSRLSEGPKKVIIHRLLQYFYRHADLQFHESETIRRKSQAADAVSPVTDVMRKGHIIALAGEKIDQIRYNKIKILNKYQDKNNLRFIIGIFILQFMLSLGVSYYLFRFTGVALRDISSNVQLHSILLTILLAAYLIAKVSFLRVEGYYLGIFVPVSYAGTMLTLLYGPRVTLAAGLYLVIFLYFMSGSESGTLMLSLVSILTGIYSGMRMEKRTLIFKGAFLTGISMSTVCLGIDLINHHIGQPTVIKFGLSFLNGFISMMLTMGILPVYEIVFNLSTRFRLQELADFNHPLLRKLAAEAPSTYTHSMMMANMCELAVSRTGGNSLLARVGCLYHDIGKMENPSFFAENRHLFPESVSFQKVGPIKAAKIILAHVIDGVRMARESRLPEKITEFIPSHHGTTTMQYFYHEALSQAAKNKKTVQKELFMYPGPRPRSKETGIAMIADSVEAAARSLENPNSENIEQLIDKIIKNKMDEHQFDECNLTISDIAIARNSFLEVLINSHHLRPRYPDKEETNALEKESIEDVNGKRKPLHKKTAKKFGSTKKIRKRK